MRQAEEINKWINIRCWKNKGKHTHKAHEPHTVSFVRHTNISTKKKSEMMNGDSSESIVRCSHHISCEPKMTGILMRSIRMRANWFVQPMELSKIVNLIINYYLVHIYRFTDFFGTNANHFLSFFSLFFDVYFYRLHMRHICDILLEIEKYSLNKNKNIHENWNRMESNRMKGKPFYVHSYLWKWLNIVFYWNVYH